MVEYRGLVTVEKIRVQIPSSFILWGNYMWNMLAIIRRIMRKLIYKIRKIINALNITSGAVLKTIMIFLIIILLLRGCF